MYDLIRFPLNSIPYQFNKENTYTYIAGPPGRPVTIHEISQFTMYIPCWFGERMGIGMHNLSFKALCHKQSHLSSMNMTICFRSYCDSTNCRFINFRDSLWSPVGYDRCSWLFIFVSVIWHSVFIYDYYISQLSFCELKDTHETKGPWKLRNLQNMLNWKIIFP